MRQDVTTIRDQSCLFYSFTLEDWFGRAAVRLQGVVGDT